MRLRPIEDDTPLIEACIREDTAAWAELVKRYSALISSSIAKALKKYGFNPLCEETEDIRQNLLASIWKSGKLADVRNRKSIAYWLAIVSGNAAIEHMRGKMPEARANLVPLSDDVDTEACDPETPEKRELSGIIERSIGSLPPKERLVAKLHLLYGMGYHEIAEMLTMPKGTVSSYIKRAKERLKEKLKDYE